MNPRTPIHWLFALLLLVAGPAGASAPEPAEPKPPCHEMAESAQPGSAHSHAGPQGQDADCEQQCQCCPGSCAGPVGLTASGLATPNSARSSITPAPASAPIHSQNNLLRPPITA